MMPRMGMVVQLACAAALAAIALPAAAQTPVIDAARAEGRVGERFDGYLGLATAVSEQVRRQVSSVNIRRRSLYTDLAERRGVTIEGVGIAAGCELLAKVRVGEVYMLSDGKWRRRGAGQPPPVPAYCAR